MKSGLPNTFLLRRHPVNLAERKRATIRSSVSRFPRARMRDITSDRFAIENTSLIPTRAVSFGVQRAA
jgi:hypothetical protein